MYIIYSAVYYSAWESSAIFENYISAKVTTVCLCFVIHLMKGEWMEDTEAGHNSTFCPLPTLYFSQNSNL